MLNKSVVTIKDVARHAGVAISTVSRVANNLNRVSEDTRKRVLNSLRELNYTPNLNAKTLKARKSLAIGFICEDIASPFIPEVIRGVEERARESRYSTIICNGNWNHKTTLYQLDMLMHRNVEGIIYSTPLRIETPLIDRLKELREKIPLVLLSEDNLEDGFHRVNIDVEQGMAAIMDHLFSLGHERISMIAGPEDSGLNAMKIDNYKRFMENRGHWRHICYIHTGYSIKQSIPVVQRLLETPKRPTAIIGAADLAVVGGIKAAHEIGLHVPKDVSFVGWGGIDIGLYTEPAITTVLIPRYQMGRNSMTILLECIENASVCVDLNSKDMDVVLEVRGSSGPAR